MCRYKAARCHRCGEAITEAAISCNGQTYHRACYTCTVGSRVTKYQSFKRRFAKISQSPVEHSVLNVKALSTRRGP